MHAPEFVSSVISDSDYRRTRLEPAPGETYFLHLKDLRAALNTVATDKRIRLLDFGCGGSPYRSLFPNAEYLRADYVPAEGLDYRIGEDQLVPAPSESFDFVFSTQVLEHVRNQDIYLRECFRLLRPGGSLILTTHGMFEEHGCPYDFRRWTAEGLKYELLSEGFEISNLKKLTTAGRALGFLLHLHCGLMVGQRRREPLAFIHWLLFRTNSFVMAWFDRWCDRRFKDCVMVDPDATGHTLYIGLFAVARKPVSGLPLP